MSNIPSLLAAVETLLTTAVPWLAPWTQKRLRDWLVAMLIGQSVVMRTAAHTLHLVFPAASAASHERRLRRMTEDRQLQWNLYATVLRWVLRFVPGERVTVIMDETTHTECWAVLTVALFYHGRAIPLAWVIWPGQTTRETGFWAASQQLLDRVRRLIPRTTPVVVVADRAFGCPVWSDQVLAHGWDVVVRVQGQSKVRSAHVPEQPIRDLATRGSTQSFAGEVFKGAGWRSLTVIATWDDRCDESLLLVSTLTDVAAIRAVYRHRFAIECLFRDWKSAGWHWESSQAQTESSAAFVVLGLALSTVVLLCLGTADAADLLTYAKQRGTRRPWEARDSLFRLGLLRVRRWLLCGDVPAVVWQLDLGDVAMPWSKRCWNQRVPSRISSAAA